MARFNPTWAISPISHLFGSFHTLILKLEVTKTIRVPVHYALTKRKLCVLNRLTARLSYGVWLFSKVIDKRGINALESGGFMHDDLRKIEKRTKLSSAYIQQCRDQAMWLWRSYQVQHRNWEQRLLRSKAKWKDALLKREPHKPFQGGLRRKVPVRVDYRTGLVQPAEHIQLSPYVVRLSTLRKYARVTIPLNPAKYHLDSLQKGKVVDFQLVERNGVYCVHICLRFEVQDVSVQSILGVDLGIRRAIATVLLRPNQYIQRKDLSIIRDGAKRHRLNMLARRETELQQARKWKPLHRLRQKRSNVIRHYDHVLATTVANLAKRESSIVAIGYPKNLRFQRYRGDGRVLLRKLLHQRFSYGRMIQLIQEKCNEFGVTAVPVSERWTSTICHRCRSRTTKRIGQSLFSCMKCGLKYNADWNAAINIGSVLFAERRGRWAIEDLARAEDELAYKPMSLEVGNHDQESHV